MRILRAMWLSECQNEYQCGKAVASRIVADSLGNITAACDGCMAGLAEMYQDYIEGKKELRQINMEFSARYIKGGERPDRTGCSYQK